MRKLAIAALFSMALAISASATPKAAGTVAAIDDIAGTFTCHWQTGDLTYTVTDRTVFVYDGQKGSFNDLAVGETVKVTSHGAGPERIADQVVISPF